MAMNHSISTMTGKTKIKIVFLGAQNVGKSSIIEKYIHNRFQDSSNPTVGIDFLAKNITHHAKNYRLQLWDTAGQERFRSLIPSYLKDAHCALIIFDVTSKASMSQIQLWAKMFNENKGGQGFIFLVGNKIDLDFRQITKDQGAEWATKMGMPYFQISAKTGQNIEQLFFNLIQYSTDKDKSLTPHKFIMDKKQIIKEEAEQENAKPAPQDTGANIIGVSETVAIVKPTETIVLKNQNVSQINGRKKGCC